MISYPIREGTKDRKKRKKVWRKYGALILVQRHCLCGLLKERKKEGKKERKKYGRGKWKAR